MRSLLLQPNSQKLANKIFPLINLSTTYFPEFFPHATLVSKTLYRSNLENIDGLKICSLQSDVKSNYAYFPVVFDEKIFGSSRNEVMAKLAANGIGARKYFYPLTSVSPAFNERYDPTETPVALHLSKRVLTLPLYADLSLDDVDRICDIIKQ